MKFKKVLSLLLSVLCVLLNMSSLSYADNEISVGNYIQMGNYYGKPILWRCVSEDDNGLLFLSDRIICFKPFDAKPSLNPGAGSHSRRKYDSNYWGDSNIRSWLNSNAPAGKVTWLCGNPPTESTVWAGYNDYSTEAGFLTCFSDAEKNVIKEVTQKSIVASPEWKNGIYSSGNFYHLYTVMIENIIKNFDDAYSENVTDKMFLLDVSQLKSVYDNSDILGKDYYNGIPTAEAVLNSEYQHQNMSDDKGWLSWLRTPYAVDSFSENVRSVASSGAVASSTLAYDGSVGVRPAFYLNSETAKFSSGTGDKANPYIIQDDTKKDFEIKTSKYTLTENALSICYVAENNTKAIKNANAIIGVYNSNDTLKTVFTSNAELTTSSSVYIKSTIDDYIYENGDYIKLMLWDSLDTIIPLTVAQTTDISK